MNAKRLNLTFIATVATVLLLPWSSAYAADFSNIDLQPWVRYRYTLFDVGENQFGELRESLLDGSVLITKGGGVFREDSERSNPVGLPIPYATGVLRGIATPVERSSLAVSIGQALVGIQTDCVSVSGPGQLWEYEIVWYGRQGRRNKFRVFFRNQANEPLPPCSQAVIDFVFAVDRLLSRVSSHPDTEIISTEFP
jgi:hypothetical protein